MKQTEQQRELVNGLHSGNPDAWRNLFKEFAPQVWRFVSRRVDGPIASAIQDIVQETMLAAARSAHGFDPARGSIWSWLRGIARNQIAMAYRKQAGHDILKRAADELAQSGGRLSRWLDGSDDLPEDLLQRKETAELVRSVLRRLPEEYSELLTAKYLDDKSTQQIAGETKASIASVNSKLARARQAFRDSFQYQNEQTTDS
ncbi:MAG: sigma-70 family RNA polymerase sigma factor [Planctomycetota bacterium]